MKKLSELTGQIKMQKHSELPQICSNELNPIQERNKIVLQKFPQPELFVSFMNHANCLTRYSDKLTIKSAYESDLITLSELANIYSSSTPFHFIESWLLQLNIFVNTENKLSGEQIKELARYMYDEIYMLNMAELTLLFKRIKNGHYGQFYNRIDSTQLVSWCRMYRWERSKVIIPIIDEKTKNDDLKKLEIKVNKRMKRKLANFKRKAKIFWKRSKNKTNE